MKDNLIYSDSIKDVKEFEEFNYNYDEKNEKN